MGNPKAIYLVRLYFPLFILASKRMTDYSYGYRWNRQCPCRNDDASHRSPARRELERGGKGGMNREGADREAANRKEQGTRSPRREAEGRDTRPRPPSTRGGYYRSPRRNSNEEKEEMGTCNYRNNDSDVRPIRARSPRRNGDKEVDTCIRRTSPRITRSPRRNDGNRVEKRGDDVSSLIRRSPNRYGDDETMREKNKPKLRETYIAKQSAEMYRNPGRYDSGGSRNEH
jgi:hypothetical protein